MLFYVIDFKKDIIYNTLKLFSQKTSQLKGGIIMFLHEGLVAVTHPLLGTIRLNDKFQKVLEIEPFRNLKFKSQLGTLAYVNGVINATHTRLMHSIGVMHLVDMLLDTIEIKYPKDIHVSQMERETLELVALGHDIGHLAFSHSLENKSLKPHEERTVELFEQYADEINAIFGYNITDKVLDVFKCYTNETVQVSGENSESGREQVNSSEQCNSAVKSKVDIVQICMNLLMGTVDCDRMEYLMTDRYMVTGDRIDYSKILEGITIDKVDATYRIVFSKEVLPLIENMLITRVIQYETIYCTKEDTISKAILKKYVLEGNWSASYIYEMQEFDILSHMHSILRLGDKKSTIYHLANAFLNGSHENIFCKRFTSFKSYEDFMRRLHVITERRDIITERWIKIKAYSQGKDSVYIKGDDGTICDLADVSTKVGECFSEFGYVIVDVDPSYKLKEDEARLIRELYEE